MNQEHLPYPDNLESMTAKAGIRITASIIDLIFRGIVYVPLGIYLAPTMMDYFNTIMNDLQQGKLIEFDFGFMGKHLLLVFIYNVVANLITQYIIPLLTKGKTVGKLVLGLRIIDVNGEYASPSQLFIRSTIYVVAPLLQYLPGFESIASLGIMIVWVVSFIFLFSDPKHQTVHDKYSGCLVVYDNEYQNKYGRS